MTPDQAPERLYAVIESGGVPMYCATWSDACHQHINDSLSAGEDGLSGAVVREFVPADLHAAVVAERDALQKLWDSHNTVIEFAGETFARMKRDHDQAAAERNKLLAERSLFKSELHKERDEAVRLMRELRALVRGECPSLLDELSGGDGRLAVAIDAFIAQHDKADAESAGG